LQQYEFEPPTCLQPSFNPLTKEADRRLPSVEKLLDALASWLRTPKPMSDPRPTKVRAKSAERTYMSLGLSEFFVNRFGEPHHTLVATTVRVALGLTEEDKFGPENVRKALGEFD